MSESFKPLLSRLADGATLVGEDADAFFSACLRGEPTPAQIAAAVTAMRLRGETVGEITACARALRRAAMHLDHDHDVIDVCGTGGDGAHTLNISTAVAFVAAGGGLKVAKHGNRAASSRCGSSDVLAALGVNLDAGPERQRRSLDEAGLCVLFAPAHHGAMRHVSPIRQELGFRTVFNLLGPLSNPAGVKRQLLGVFSPAWLEPLAQVLKNLGSERVWLVHGSDGLDELTVTGPSFVTALEAGEIRSFEITPEMAGLSRANLAELKGGDAMTNAAALNAVLGGARNAYRDIAILNAAAALVIAEKARDLTEGAALAGAALDSGRAAGTLAKLVKVSNQGSSSPLPGATR